MTVRKPLRRANAASARRKARGRLVLKLLGPPRIERGGLAVEMDTRKATALVAYLAVTGQPQARDSLAALLWPDAVAERARGALRRTLSTLRTGLGGEEVRVEGVRISIDPEAIDLDVRRFRALVVEDRLDEAVTAYTGDFLAGFTLRDSAEFDEWQAAQAEELRGELAGVLERLASSEEPRRALAYANRWLELDPLHESAHRALMRIHARAGDRVAALRQFHECERILDRELGVAPLAETVTLARAIERGESEPATRRTSTARSAEESVGDLHTRHGDYVKAIESYEVARVKANAADRGEIDHKLADVHHRRGDWDEAEAHYKAALRGQDDPALRARITADWSMAAHRRGDVPRATRLAEDALAQARRAKDERAVAQALNIVGILSGDRRRLEESLEIAARVGDDATRIAALNNLALALGRSGQYEQAIELTRQALAGATALGDRHREAALHNNLADLFHRSGRQDDAMRELRRSARLFSEIGGEAGAMQPEVWKLVQW
ncbi:MAG TPA: tetratricopeptide repeat protein [Candidatus Limnocylindria bacterium]